MLVRTLFKGFFNIYCHLVYKLEVRGLENIPKEGAAIVCSNHVHFLDSISIVIFIKRMIYPMAKEELFNTKFKNWFFRQVGCFPVKRGKGDTEALEVAKGYLKQGDMLLMFPEGTRNLLAKGGKMKKGAAVIALSENTPIIPIGIKGDYKPFTKVRINIGKPMTLEDYKTGEELDPRQIIELTNKLQTEIISLRDVEDVKKIENKA